MSENAKNKLVAIEGLNLSWQDRRLVNNIKLTVYEGEMLGVVGESGSGKTLTARCIVNLVPEGLEFEAKKFEVFGHEFLNMPPDEKRIMIGREIGFVPQNTVFYLHPMIKIKNQIVDGYIYHTKNELNIHTLYIKNSIPI